MLGFNLYSFIYMQLSCFFIGSLIWFASMGILSKYQIEALPSDVNEMKKNTTLVQDTYTNTPLAILPMDKSWKAQESPNNSLLNDLNRLQYKDSLQKNSSNDSLILLDPKTKNRVIKQEDLSFPIEVVTYKIRKETTSQSTKNSAFYSLEQQELIRENLSINNYDELSTLTQDSLTLFVGVESRHFERYLNVFDRNLHTNKLQFLNKIVSQSLDSMQVIGIKEPPFDTQDIDLLGQYLPSTSLNGNNINAHPTEMAKILAGNGNSFVLGRGIAPFAKLQHFPLADLLPDRKSTFEEQNIMVINHSYGTEIENFYGSLALEYDKQTWNYPYILHVFSAGNMGQGQSEHGLYANVPGAATLTGNFKQAKNVLVVGSVDTVGREQYFSSGGPTYDGRIKPELMAYSSVGTSNSAATVSGVAAVLATTYQNTHQQRPESALLKAILLTGADDLGHEGPDFTFGYGNLNARKSWEILQEQQYFTAHLQPEQKNLHSLQIPENTESVKLSLVWNDPPALPNSEKALIHDLELRLIDTEGNMYLPWVLNTHPDQINAPAQVGRDSINVVEQITIKSPPAGTYSIEVYHEGKLYTPQAYHLAYYIASKNTFRWESPLAGSNFPFDGKTRDYLRWESHLSEEVGDFYFQLVDVEDTDWQPLFQSVDLGLSSIPWVPENVSGRAILKMENSSGEFVSDTFFISAPPAPKLGFACEEQGLLTWNKMEEANHYEVYVLQGDRMALYTQTTDTFLLQSDWQQFSSQFFKVMGRHENGFESLPSPATQAALLGDYCYVKTFIALVEEDNIVQVQAQLGTNYGIQKLSLWRKINQSKTLVQEWTHPGTLPFAVADSGAAFGYNEYELQIDLEQGGQLVFHSGSVFLMNQAKLWHFPNPSRQGQEITIYAEDYEEEGEIRILNQQGQLVYRREINGIPVGISGSSFKRGLYYIIYQSESRRISSKWLVE